MNTRDPERRTRILPILITLAALLSIAGICLELTPTTF